MFFSQNREISSIKMLNRQENIPNFLINFSFLGFLRSKRGLGLKLKKMFLLNHTARRNMENVSTNKTGMLIDCDLGTKCVTCNQNQKLYYYSFPEKTITERVKQKNLGIVSFDPTFIITTRLIDWDPGSTIYGTGTGYPTQRTIPLRFTFKHIK